MSDLNAAVRAFFEKYERANAVADSATLAACYADVFFFAGPDGAQPVKKDDFLKLIPKRKEFFKSLGLLSSTLASVEASTLDAKYILARTAWNMRIERPGQPPADSRNSTTYVLSTNGDSFQIIFQIDHQDLAKRLQEA